MYGTFVVQFLRIKKILEKERSPREHGGVAQLGEHLPCKQGVMGSNPIISTSGMMPQSKIGEVRADLTPQIPMALFDEDRMKLPNGERWSNENPRETTVCSSGG